MTERSQPQLIFEGGFDEQEAYEAHSRGYRSSVFVKLVDGSKYSIVFYDPIRLKQDLETESEAGWSCIAEPGMIVVPEVTLECMRRAVEQLAAEGFFESLVPVL